LTAARHQALVRAQGARETMMISVMGLGWRLALDREQRVVFGKKAGRRQVRMRWAPLASSAMTSELTVTPCQTTPLPVRSSGAAAMAALT
jgi:hypothetical protein